MILSLSSGINDYITAVQQDTLSNYPLTIEKESFDMTSLILEMISQNTENGVSHEKDKIYSNNILSQTCSMINEDTKENNLEAFQTYLEGEECEIDDYASAIQYSYDFDLQLYSSDTENGVTQVNPSNLGTDVDVSSNSMAAYMTFGDVFQEMLDNSELLESQYDVLAGRMPDSDAYDELVLVADENNEISDVALYTLGLMDQEEYQEIMEAVINGETIVETETASFTYDELLNTS